MSWLSETEKFSIMVHANEDAGDHIHSLLTDWALKNNKPLHNASFEGRN